MRSIENYQIDYGRIYGSGSYGTVYKCIDVRDNQRRLCVKIVNYIQYEKEKFLRELNVMKAIINDGKFNQNIVRVELATEDKGLLYFVMEKCDQDLKQYLDDRNRSNYPMKLAEALDCIRQILNGYKVLFEYGLMHRDIKPENILIIFNNGQPIYKLADFGMAKLHKSHDKAEQTVKGTPIWASPQVFQGQSYSHKTDIYSLGLMFFFIIFGSLPYGAYGNIKDRKQLIEIQGSFKINPFIVDFKKIQDRVDIEPLKVKQLAQLIESMIRYDEDDRIQFENLFSHSLINIDAARRLDIDEDLFKTQLPVKYQQQNNQIQSINSDSTKQITQVYNNNGLKQLQTLQPQPSNLIQQNIPIVQQHSQLPQATLQTQQPQQIQNLRNGLPIGINSQPGQPFPQPISNNMVKPLAFQLIQPQNQQQILQQNLQLIQNQNFNNLINNQQNGQHSKRKIQILIKKKNFESILLENFQRYISINTQAENTVLDLIYICCTYFIQRQPWCSGHYQVHIEQLKYDYQDCRKQDFNNLSCIELTRSLQQLYKQNNQLFPFKQKRFYYQEYIRMISFLEFIIGSFPTDKLIQEALDYSCDPQKEIVELIHYIQVQRTQ